MPMHSSYVPLGIGGREGSWLADRSLFFNAFMALCVIYFLEQCVRMWLCHSDQLIGKTHIDLVTFVLFCFCLFAGFRSSVSGWWRCSDGGFEKNELRLWWWRSSCWLFILPSCLGGWLWAGPAWLLSVWEDTNKFNTLIALLLTGEVGLGPSGNNRSHGF